MATGTAKLQLLIDLQNKLSIGLDAAKNQVKKATGEMQSRLDSLKTGALKSFNDIKSQFPIVGNAVKLLTNPIAAVAAAVAVATMAYQKFKAAVAEWKNLARSQIEAETKLGQVMRNTMGASDAEIQSIKNLTAAQQKIGVIGDEVQLAGAQELGTYLGKADSLKALIPVMNDMLAQQYGFNATQEQAATIAGMLGKVMDGQVGALSRYGYKFNEQQEKILKFGTESQRVATLIDVVSASVGGVNEALAKTPQGMMKQVENDMGDLREAAGILFTELETAWLPLEQAALSFWQKILHFVENHKEEIMNAITTVANFFAGAINTAITTLSTLKSAFMFIYEWRGVIYGIIAAVAILNAKLIAQAVVLDLLAIKTELATIKQWLFNVAASANPIGLIVIAIGALIGGLVMAYQKFDKFRAIVQGSWEVIKGFGKILKDFVIDRIKGIISGIGSIGSAISKLFKGDFSGAWEDAKQGVADLSGANAVKKALENTKALKDDFKNEYNKSLEESKRKKEEEEKQKSEGDFAGVPGEKNKENRKESTKAVDDTVSIGKGSQSKSITINIDSFIKGFNPTHQSINNMSKDELERWITGIFNGVAASASRM